jgi:thiol:disulfide interchange protein DsbD
MRLPAVLVLLLAALAAPAHALETAPVTSARATVTLVTDTDAIAPGKPFRVGLRFVLAPGWHTYWQNPGDAGTPPEITFDLPKDTTAGGIEWPAPIRLREGPVTTYSYENAVLLPVTVTPGSTPLHLVAHADWLVCEKICVPEEGSFTLDLPAGTPAPSAQAPLFAAADRRLPRPSPFTATLAPDAALTLTGPGLSADAVKDAWFLPAAWGAIDQGAAQRVEIGSGLVLHLTPGPQFKADAPLTGVLGLRDGGGQESFYAIDAKPGAAPAVAPAPAPAPQGEGLAKMLGFALLGGLILNLMPCVFPILAMKALALARMGGAARSHARVTAWAYLGGVLVAFATLGLLLIGARAAGAAAGWGFQFQSPVFVAAMAFVLFAVGLNLSGVFTFGARASGAGQSLAARGGLAGSFFTGLLAVVVATPCTAPFMGAAIAAALAAPVWAAFAIFLTMGLGLALPYVLLAEIPALARRLPRPGRWMDILRQALAFPMYGAAAWLVWVAGQQTGPAGLPLVLAGLVLVGLAAWAMGLADSLVRAPRRIALGVAAIAAIGALALLPGLDGAAPAVAAQAEGTDPSAQAYSPARLAALRAAGTPVFVNMTAAWCVSCLVNERVALGTEDVRRAFAARGIVTLKGDWTRQDRTITDFLRAHGRDGVPLYLFYAPGAAEPTVLPQILTSRTVLDAVGSAGS